MPRNHLAGWATAMLVVAGLGSLACGSSGNDTGATGTTTTGDQPTHTIPTGTGGAGGTGGTGGTTGSGGTGGTGGVTGAHGPAATDLVSAGEVCSNSTYKMVFTLGQSSQNQGKMTAPGYRLQGGLVGANGSLP